jgi:hypothetical protein
MRLSLLGGASDLSADATHIYFADGGFKGGEAVFRLSKEGGLPEAIALEEKAVDSLVIDDAHAYWVGSGPAAIRSAPKMGGVLPRVVSVDPVAYEQGLAVDGEHVYARRWKGPVVRIPKGGGEARVVADPGGSVAAVDEGFVYFFTEQAIVKAPKGGQGAAITLASGQRPSELVIDASHVYWINPATATEALDGAVLRVPKAGGPVTVVADKQALPACLRVTADRVWFCNRLVSSATTPRINRDPRIASVPKGGGEIAADTMETTLRDILIDGTWVYYASHAKSGGGDVIQRRPL